MHAQFYVYIYQPLSQLATEGWQTVRNTERVWGNQSQLINSLFLPLSTRSVISHAGIAINTSELPIHLQWQLTFIFSVLRLRIGSIANFSFFFSFVASFSFIRFDNRQSRRRNADSIIIHEFLCSSHSLKYNCLDFISDRLIIIPTERKKK